MPSSQPRLEATTSKFCAQVTLLHPEGRRDRLHCLIDRTNARGRLAIDERQFPDCSECHQGLRLCVAMCEPCSTNASSLQVTKRPTGHPMKVDCRPDPSEYLEHAQTHATGHSPVESCRLYVTANVGNDRQTRTSRATRMTDKHGCRTTAMAATESAATGTIASHRSYGEETLVVKSKGQEAGSWSQRHHKRSPRDRSSHISSVPQEKYESAKVVATHRGVWEKRRAAQYQAMLDVHEFV